MIGWMALAIALLGFNDLGLFVSPIFLLMDDFLYRFSTFNEKKNKQKFIDHKFELFAKCIIEFPFFLALLRLSVQRVQIPLESLVKTLVAFGIIYVTDLLYKIGLRSSPLPGLIYFN